MVRTFETSDRIRVDIPDESDPDHKLHGQHGTVINVFEDDAGLETGRPRDDVLYRVEMDDEEIVDLRSRDVRPPFDEE